MPELPEVEIISRQLSQVIRGQKVVKVEVLRKKSWQGQILKVEGKEIKAVERKAKLVIIRLSGKLSLVIHLKMTGQLIYESRQGRIVGGHPTADWVSKLPSKHTRVIIELNKGKLFFNDMRVFGWIKVLTDQQRLQLVGQLPPDVVDKEFDQEYLAKMLAESRRAVKLVIMDQSKLGGVGNIYANDGLWCCGIDPRKRADKVAEDKGKVRQLWRCLIRVIGMGIKYGGATASDKAFVNVGGLGGNYQEHFLVYERAGKQCRNCGSRIKKVKLGGRGSYFCPKCQQ